VIAAEQKRFARIAVIDAVIEEIERGCASHNFALPPASDIGL
jgi:hypothetical protein